MWQFIIEGVPGTLGIICTILSFAIPFIIGKINQELHKYGDPPWKEEK
ncbi:hypothetical protein GCM10009001_13940 [Virgibacillus siamensis]|uniref:Uncharacterized protein n=1 Tax=Virgibacillus siamensis TaxID=480071 RepID=A0ABN1FVW1_9BACI